MCGYLLGQNKMYSNVHNPVLKKITHLHTRASDSKQGFWTWLPVIDENRSEIHAESNNDFLSHEEAPVNQRKSSRSVGSHIFSLRKNSNLPELKTQITRNPDYLDYSAKVTQRLQLAGQHQNHSHRGLGWREDGQASLHKFNQCMAWISMISWHIYIPNTWKTSSNVLTFRATA